MAYILIFRHLYLFNVPIFGKLFPYWWKLATLTFQKKSYAFHVHCFSNSACVVGFMYMYNIIL